MKYPFRTGVCVFLWCAFSLLYACSMKSGAGQSAPMEQMSRTPGAVYDGSVSWEGTGFNGEAAASAGAPPSPAYKDMSNLYGKAAQIPENSPPLSADTAGQTRKLVKRAEIRLRVEDPAATEKPLASLMEKYGAWPASAVISENTRTYTIRVPSASYDAMLTDLTGLGKILRRSESAEDVTLRYYDLESRLATRRELLKTYQGYLGRAKNIDEIMTVESRIADLQQEIDQTGTQFRNLSGLIDYSTINVDIAGPVTAVSYSAPTLREKLGELFSSFGEVISTALVVLMGIIIYGVPAVLIIILLFWLLFGRIGLLKKIWRLAAGKK